MMTSSETHIEDELMPVMRTPRNVQIEITARCNLRCRYCYFFNNPEVEYRDLSTEEWLTFFDELGRAGVMRLSLAGGEPFIREDLPELLEGIVRNRLRFSLLSNGGLIDDEIAAFIAGTGRCDYVQVSVDGSCPETHDAGRGVEFHDVAAASGSGRYAEPGGCRDGRLAGGDLELGGRH